MKYLRKNLPVKPKFRALWSSPDTLTELSIGYDQTRFFCRYALGNPNDVEVVPGGPWLLTPTMPAAFAKDYDEASEAEDAWRDEWGDGLIKLGVFAAALTLLDLRETKLPLPVAPNCTFGVFDDIEMVRDAVQPNWCDALDDIDKRWRKDARAPISELFERPKTLEWAKDVAKTGARKRQGLTIAVLDQVATRFPVAQLLGKKK